MMTKFEELMDIITHNKNKDKKKVDDTTTNDNNDVELEVSGTESTRAPLASFGDELSDPDLIDSLYTKPRHKPNDGFGASAWDSDY